jgi:hypothetical protein
MVDPVKTTEILENPPFFGPGHRVDSGRKTQIRSRSMQPKSQRRRRQLTTGCPQATARGSSAENS